MKQLNEIVKEQLENISAFRDILHQQQQFIIHNNVDELAENLVREEKIILCIGEIQSKIDSIPGSMEKIKTSPLFKELKEELLKIIKLNNQNRILAENSKHFIKTLLTNLVFENHNLLDRKV